MLSKPLGTTREGFSQTKRLLGPSNLGSRKSSMTSDLELTYAKLMNPRMSAGLMVLYSLLGDLKGIPVEPREVRKTVDALVDKRKVSKQSITNTARRLEEANIIDRKENKYTVNYGYLISVLLNTVLEMTKKIEDLEDEIINLKTIDR
ncbi:MAG: MarR family transcriptional regulator [Candidatus Thorarchaeota archaeon]